MALELPFKASLFKPPLTNPTSVKASPLILTLPRSPSTARILSLRISRRLRNPVLSVSRCVSQLPSSDDSESSPLKKATFDLKLPRRSLIVQFTCNSCGERTQRTVNRVAYERGTVFVQCAGCLQHHKLIDNLGLVVEYDLRDNVDDPSDANQG
ncbi:hypothetical protein QJS10_CPB14g00167 [Acorus calamus]|uniref:DNL-type domain-containing protein n=1 Tax=Acorus calamus TaxID=4465 RepID=A0AAV9DE45_ACOCL|nr:hypothetical protein QJS10_CPB14g00167 [Acorus calamus]